MKDNKITAEEQDTNKTGKLCPERKACGRKWLATFCISSGRHENALVQKKSKQGGSRIWRLIKNEEEFPGVTKKKPCGISRGLGFWHRGISKGCNTILQNFQGWSFGLPGISRGKVKKRRIPGWFLKKNVLNPPCFFFSVIAQWVLHGTCMLEQLG